MNFTYSIRINNHVVITDVICVIPFTTVQNVIACATVKNVIISRTA